MTKPETKPKQTPELPQTPIPSLTRARQSTASKVGGPSLAIQSAKDECDINLIMKKFRDTGTVTHVKERQPYYADVSQLGDYQNSMNQIKAAEESFQSLPSRTRKRFNNDPAEMLSFLGDKQNKDEAIKLGLIKPPEVPTAPVKVEVVTKEEKK